MRVLIVTDSYFPTRDGVATQVLTTKQAMESMGHEVFICAPRPVDPKDEEEGVYYIKAKPFKTYEGYLLPEFRHNNLKFVKDLKPDIIHVLIGGQIVHTGGPEVATMIEEEGFDQFIK